MIIMYCAKCGKMNDESAAECIQCGNQLQSSVSEGEAITIPNYLARSIIVTIFCCLPFGIAAIIYSAQVNGKIRAKVNQTADTPRDELEKLALSNERVKEFTDGKDVKKVIVVPNKLVNIVVK